MALSRTLELLKAGERINDLLYRSTLDGNRRALGRRWAFGEALAELDAGSGHGRRWGLAAHMTQMPR